MRRVARSRRFAGTLRANCGNVGLLFYVVGNGEDAGHAFGAGALRRQLHAVVSNAGNGARSIRRDARVGVVGIACRGESGATLIHYLARGASVQGLFRALRDVDDRFVFVNNGVVCAGAYRVVGNFYRPNDAGMVKDANFGLREGFVGHYFLGEGILCRFSPALVEQRTIRPFFFSVGGARANEAVSFVYERNGRIDVRILRVGFRVECKLHAICRCECPIDVDDDGRLFSKVGHSRCVKGLHCARCLHPI